MTYCEKYELNCMFIYGDAHVEEWNDPYEIAFYGDTLANRLLDETMLWMGV